MITYSFPSFYEEDSTARGINLALRFDKLYRYLASSIDRRQFRSEHHQDQGCMERD